MTTKADFTSEEWETIVEAPTLAAMMVITSSPGGTFRETFAFARAWSDAREAHGASALLDALAAEKPKLDRKKFGSTEELRAKGEEELAAVAALLAQKATPDELDAYRKFVLAAAERVAAAHKENGDPISPEEQATLDEIRGHLGLS
jgi:hypothetical protein